MNFTYSILKKYDLTVFYSDCYDTRHVTEDDSWILDTMEPTVIDITNLDNDYECVLVKLSNRLTFINTTDHKRLIKDMRCTIFVNKEEFIKALYMHYSSASVPFTHEDIHMISGLDEDFYNTYKIDKEMLFKHFNGGVVVKDIFEDH